MWTSSFWKTAVGVLAMAGLTVLPACEEQGTQDGYEMQQEQIEPAEPDINIQEPAEPGLQSDQPGAGNQQQGVQPQAQPGQPGQSQQPQQPDQPAPPLPPQN